MPSITQNYLTISPAYGRDYTSSAKAIVDFKAGKDFCCESYGMGGSYCSIRDFADGVTVCIRYAKKRKETNYTVRSVSMVGDSQT